MKVNELEELLSSCDEEAEVKVKLPDGSLANVKDCDGDTQTVTIVLE